MPEPKISMLLVAAAILSGCASSPQSYESTPVKIETSKGLVTCQLYTRDRVLWDRAIDRPSSMSVKEADSICLAEGKRWKASK